MPPSNEEEMRQAVAPPGSSGKKQRLLAALEIQEQVVLNQSATKLLEELRTKVQGRWDQKVKKEVKAGLEVLMKHVSCVGLKLQESVASTSVSDADRVHSRMTVSKNRDVRIEAKRRKISEHEYRLAATYKDVETPLRTNTRSHANRVSSNFDDIELPLPTNGEYYSPPEIVKILAPLPKKVRQVVIRTWVEKKLVPISYSTVMRYLKLYKEKGLDGVPTDHGCAGRCALIPATELMARAKKLYTERGIAIDRDGVSKIIAEYHQDKAGTTGTRKEDWKPSPQTISRAMRVIVASEHDNTVGRTQMVSSSTA